MKKESRESVLHDWVCDLPFTQQALLMLATRGPDSLPKDTPAKEILHYLRGAIIKPAYFDFYKEDGFMNIDYGEVTYEQDHYNNDTDIIYQNFGWRFVECGDEFFRHVDELPHHFYMHIIHAAEVLGYKFPDERVMRCWYDFYGCACKSFHMNPETLEQLDQRLKK